MEFWELIVTLSLVVVVVVVVEDEMLLGKSVLLDGVVVVCVTAVVLTLLLLLMLLEIPFVKTGPLLVLDETEFLLFLRGEFVVDLEMGEFVTRLE